MPLECGSFYHETDYRIHRAVVHEDMWSLIVKSASFARQDFTCLSCLSGHKLLPKRRNLPQWEGFGKLIILTDQNFGAVLPMEGNKCPIVVRVGGGGWLHEIGDAFLEFMDEHTLPEGSVILLGSLSDLMNQGSAGLAKALCREVRRLVGCSRVQLPLSRSSRHLSLAPTTHH